jgi:hypothetical protein
MFGNKNQVNRIYKTGPNHPFAGKKHSEETKRKMRETYKLRFGPGKTTEQTGRADTVQTVQLTLAQEV